MSRMYVMDEKLIKKQGQLIERTAEAFGVSISEAEDWLHIERQQSLRINTLTDSNRSQLLKKLGQLGWRGEAYSWHRDGLSIEAGQEKIRDSDLVANGDIYIQNAASWLPVLALDPKPKETILDMCAAPGGKASHIAALTSNQSELWLNDNSKPRLVRMQHNTERLRAKPYKITLSVGERLPDKLHDVLFDRILLDAPCSGEGLLTLSDSKSLTYWSLAHIKRLERLQKKLIKTAWQMLKPGGTLVYSTCTMAPEENEKIIDYLLRKNDDAELVDMPIDLPNRRPAVMEWRGRQFKDEMHKVMRLHPSLQIEAFFVAKIVKVDKV